MGIALILIGLLGVATAIDFAAENDLAGAPDRAFALFGGSFEVNETQIVLGAAVLGAVAVLCIVFGVGLTRGSRGRRRTMKRRISDLERENERLRTIGTEPVVVIPDREFPTPASADSPSATSTPSRPDVGSESERARGW